MNMVPTTKAVPGNDLVLKTRSLAVIGGGLGGGSPPMLNQILSIIRRRKWVILGTISFFVALGFVVTLLMTPKYTVTATLEIQRETSGYVKIEGVQDKGAYPDQEFYQTQYGLLQSESLARRVAADLKLYDDREFFRIFGLKPDRVFSTEKGAVGALNRQERVEQVAKELLDNFVVRPDRLSRLVSISFTSPSAQLSRRIVDAWSVDFIKITLERRFEATAYARNFLEGRLVQLRARIDESERRLVDYASREGIVNLPASAQAGSDGPTSVERSLTADDLTALNAELSRAKADRIKAESRLTSKDGAISEALTNDAINRLRERRAEISADLAKLLAQFEPTYPPAEALKSQLDQLDRSITREQSRVTNALQQEYRSSRDREANLDTRVAALKSEMLDLRRRSIQYNIFRRDVDTNQQLYEGLLQRYKEIGVAGGVGVNNISVVDPAITPDKPSSPKLVLNMAISLLVGMIFGVGIALLLEQIDQGIVDPAEVEPFFGLPLLGTIPKITDQSAIESLDDMKSVISEAYLSLEANLSFATEHGMARSLAVTSTKASEGKSLTTFALAKLLARKKRPTILIDGDLRSPSVHQLSGLKNLVGLSNFLAGDDDIAAMIRPTNEPNLFVLTAGPQPPSAPELLSTDRLVMLIDRLRERFDYVLIDAPPVMGLADSPLIASRVEGVLFVLECDATQRGLARVAVERLFSPATNLLGIVLTKFNARKANYGYGYDYGYGYSYGDRNLDPSSS